MVGIHQPDSCLNLLAKIIEFKALAELWVVKYPLQFLARIKIDLS